MLFLVPGDREAVMGVHAQHLEEVVDILDRQVLLEIDQRCRLVGGVREKSTDGRGKVWVFEELGSVEGI